MICPYDIKRALYRQFVGGLSACSYHNKNSDKPAVFYGGAMAGHMGGPQVKVELLNQFFPQSRFNFNLLYLLSGALHMPQWAIKNLKYKNIPIILNQNGVFYPAWSPKIWERENKRMADAINLSSHVFYQSEFCKKSADKFLGVTAKSYDILYNGVDTKMFAPKNGRKNKNFQFLVTGNISPSTSYRVHDALQALYVARKQGLNCEISFHGFLPPDVLADIKYKIIECNLENYFILNGAYSREKAPDIFANADAYIMTKHNDPCPNVVLEAMSCGLPVLHVSSGGVPELVGESAGVCVQVEETYEHNARPSIDDMVAGMSEIIKNHETLSNFVRMRCVEKFDISIWIKRHEDVFISFLKNKCGR